MQPTNSSAEPDPSAPIRIAPLTAAIPRGIPTDVVLLQPGIPAPLPVLDDADWPKVRGYEILTVIGTGGMGIVYMARQRDLQRTVALKMLRGYGHLDSEYRDRLQAEAETVAKLQHPNIIQVFEIGTVEPQHGESHPSPFISFEFVDGGSLMQRTEAPQPPEYAAQIIEKVARAVHAAHGLGVIHRDLKPANVLLTRGGEPKVADFGLAKQFGAEGVGSDRYLTRAGIVMGTPGYMAPEQAAGEAVTPAIDTYALGVILYELLTARVPFQGATPAETMYLVRDQEPVSPRQLQPKLPRDLETICLKCLQKDVHDRYESAEALANDLARWREGRPILARPVGFLERTIRAARRNPAVATLSVLVVLVTLAGVSGVIWKWQEALVHAAAATTAAEKAEAAATIAQEAARSERWERYRSHIAAASNALQLNNVVAARQALEAAPEEHRSWEWHHLYQQLDAAQYVLRWPDTVSGEIRFSPDGRWALVEATGGMKRVWDLVERREVRTFPATAGFHFPKLSNDGKTISSFGPDNTVFLVDVATDRRQILRGHTDQIFTTLFTSDCAQIRSFSKDGTIRVWNVATGELKNVEQFSDESVRGAYCSWNAEYNVVVYEQPREMKLRYSQTKQLVLLHGEEHRNLGVDFSPDDTRMLTIESFPGNNFHLWETATGKRLATFRGHTNQIQTIRFSPDNSRIATASMDQTARIWDAASGKSIATLREHKGWVNDIRFSPDGKQLLTTSQDQTLRLWDSAEGKPLAVLRGHTGDVLAASYTANGKQIVSGSQDGTIRIWDIRNVENNGAIRGPTKFVYGVAFHPAGERAASASWDGTVRVWDVNTGQQRWTVSYGDKYVVSSVAFHPNGHILASLGREEEATGGKGSLRLWDVETSAELHRWELKADWRDSRLTFSPDGNLLAAGSVDGWVRLWDVKTKEQVGQLRMTDAIRDVAFSPDSRLLAAAGEDASAGIRVWDIATKSLVAELRGHSARIYALAFSPDGKSLASGSSDRTVRLWDTATWKEVGVLKHGANVYCVAFNRDGTRVFSACADNTIRIWDVKTHNEVAELRGHDDYVHSIAFSPDGKRLLSGSGDSTLRVWDTVSPQARARTK